MPIKFGVGIVTYNRWQSLEVCLAKIRRSIPEPFSLVIADDGSTDETRTLCERENLPCLTGCNMGIAWNKNRALFFLHQILECDVILLFEDDCHPNDFGWHYPWLKAAAKWGHANFGGDWLHEFFLSGTGQVDDPFVSISVSGQCAAFTRRALSVCGFLDPRFRQYGYEHAEHSGRLVRAGFGGEVKLGRNGKLVPHFYLLAANFTMLRVPSYRDDQSLVANWQVWKKMKPEPVFRYPWRSRVELEQFRSELEPVSRGLKLTVSQRLKLAAKWSRWRTATPKAVEV